MSTPEERIRELARKSAIDETAAARLLAAVRPAPRPSSWNPFDRWSAAVTCATGVAVTLVFVGLSRLHIRTPGTLDLQITGRAVSLVTAAFDQVVAVPVTALVLWAAARVLARNVRLVDVLGAVGFARVGPATVAVPLALLSPADGSPQGVRLYLILALALVGIGLHVLLLVLGFRTATGLQGGRLAAAFVGGLVAAEIISKILLGIVPTAR